MRTFAQSSGISATENTGIGHVLGECIDVKFTGLLFQAVSMKQEMTCAQQAAMNWSDASSCRFTSPTCYTFKVILPRGLAMVLGFVRVLLQQLIVCENYVYGSGGILLGTFSQLRKSKVLDKIYKSKLCIIKAFYKGIRNFWLRFCCHADASQVLRIACDMLKIETMQMTRKVTF